MSADRPQAESASHPGAGVATLVYNVLIALALPIALVFLAHQWLIRKKGRESLLPRLGLFDLGGEALRARRPVIWVHAVSVGEVMAAIPLIKGMKKAYPSSALWVSTITETGQSMVRQKLPEVDRVVYFPFDLPWTVRKFIRGIRPALFVLLETEIWPNFLFSLARCRIPSILVNGRISARSYRGYRLLLPFFRRVFEGISLFSVQTRQDRERLLKLGVDPDKVICTGNMKYDQAVRALQGEDRELKSALKLSDACQLVLAGSTHEGEEAAVVNGYLRLSARHPNTRLLLAPRHLDRLDRVEALVRQLGLKSVRKTKLDASEFSELPGDTVILLDTLGELSGLYHAAAIVFVGGSLVPIGGHNLLEPAACAKPILFGPYMENFHEISRLLVERGGGCQVLHADQLFMEIEALLLDSERCRAMGHRAREVVLANQGVVEKNLALIHTLLKASGEAPDKISHGASVA